MKNLPDFFFFCTQAFAYLHDMRHQGEIYSFKEDWSRTDM